MLLLLVYITFNVTTENVSTFQPAMERRTITREHSISIHSLLEPQQKDALIGSDQR